MRLLLDTNAIISLLKNEGNLIEVVSKASAVNISIISQLEFLSFPEISAKDISLFKKFISRVNVIDLNHSDIKLLQKITTIRKKLWKIWNIGRSQEIKQFKIRFNR